MIKFIKYIIEYFTHYQVLSICKKHPTIRCNRWVFVYYWYKRGEIANLTVMEDAAKTISQDDINYLYANTKEEK